MPLSRRVANAIWGRSGGRCYVEPTEELFRTALGDVPVGQVAHIVAESVDGPRGDDPLPSEERNVVANLILVCPNHHAEIDGYPEIWTVDRLRSLKSRHEAWVRDRLDDRARFQERWARAETVLEIEFEKGLCAELPTFTFAVQNVGSTEVVLYSVDADLLSAEVLPSVVDREHRLATHMNIMRRRITFDLESRAAGHSVEAGPDVQLSRDERSWDPFELAIALAPTERQLFTVSVKSADFKAGTFRLVARYWDEPARHMSAVSSDVGLFVVRDTGGALGSSEPPKVLEARVLGLRELEERALKPSAPTRRLRGRRPTTTWAAGDTDSAPSAALFQRAIGALDEPEARRAVESWLSGGVPDRAIAAVAAIGACRVTAWRSAMAERALSADQVEVRVRAVDLIDVNDRIEPEVAEALALQALNDPSADVRQAAVRGVQYTASGMLREQLQRMAETDRSATVRRSAVEAVSKRRTT